MITTKLNAETAPWEQNKPDIARLRTETGWGLVGTPDSVPQALAAIAPFVNDTLSINQSLVMTVCTHLGLLVSDFSSSKYIEDEDWCLLGGGRIDNFIKENNWVGLTPHTYAKFKDGWPVCTLSIRQSTGTNYIVNSCGFKEYVDTVEQLCCDLIKPLHAERAGRRDSIIELSNYDYNNNPMWSVDVVRRNSVVKPEFYPYIESGPIKLISDFIESDESVMIWYGAPGTGKTSAVRGSISDLNLLPVTAVKESVINNQKFISDIFTHSDSVYTSNLMNVTRSKLAAEDTSSELLGDGIFAKYLMDKYGYSRHNDYQTRVPLILIEDADGLLAKRSKGNNRMSQLLNEADGLTGQTNRKIIFTSNMKDLSEVDEALLRSGRCFGAFEFRKLTPDQAIVARAAAGLPPFDKVPTKDLSLADALAKPRKKYFVGEKEGGFGFL